MILPKIQKYKLKVFQKKLIGSFNQLKFILFFVSSKSTYIILNLK
jgi:hypothetical protein